MSYRRNKIGWGNGDLNNGGNGWGAGAENNGGNGWGNAHKRPRSPRPRQNDKENE